MRTKRRWIGSSPTGHPVKSLQGPAAGVGHEPFDGGGVGRRFDRLGEGLAVPQGVEGLAGEGVDRGHKLVGRVVGLTVSNNEIASALYLSVKTVSRHLSNIFTKIGVTSRAGATAFAFEHQLVETRR